MTHKLVHVLSDDFHSPNGRGLLHPLIVHRKMLADNGIDVKIFAEPRGQFADCDVLIVDSKHFHGALRGQLRHIQEQLERFKSRCNKLAWYDSTDSAGWVAGGILPIVQQYFKSQLLRDRTAYLKPMHGRRVYTDFYHRENHIIDDTTDDAPQVGHPELLNRIHLGWNSGLANYTRHGPTLMWLYEHSRIPFFLKHTRPSGEPTASRPIPLSCRMGISYNRKTVSYQRQQLRARLSQHIASNKLARGAYFRELRKSRAVISPFGLGEITLKDFEVFLTGGLLVKPDMSHLRTWPDFYQDKQTILTFRWDFEDLDFVVDNIANNPGLVREIAEKGQKEYLRYVASNESAELFYKHFSVMLNEAPEDG